MSMRQEIQQEVRDAAHEAAPWVVRLARFGYACKGVMYGTMGLLAARAAVGLERNATDTRGALQRIGEQPFGQVLLLIVALGLVGYALWQLTRAALDPEGQGNKLKGLAKRLGYLISSGAYIGLAVYAFRVASRGRAVEGGRSPDDWTALLMQQPFGQWLVGLAGLIALGVVGNQLYAAFKARFMRRLDLSSLGEQRREAVKRLGQLGIFARSVVVAIIGVFLLLAAWRHDPKEAGGIGEALRTVEQQPYGPVLLGVMAAGLIAYGLYAFVQGFYRKINVA